MERYEHKVVLITGAGDIAGATARRLLSEGGKVALTDFSREAVSYTHLDVYKRQDRDSSGCSWTASGRCSPRSSSWGASTAASPLPLRRR